MRSSKSHPQFLRFVCMLTAGIVMLASDQTIAAGDSETTTLPRLVYNDGTKKLRDGKLQEAETALEAAVASQSATIQAPALYNLGETRFRQGTNELKKAQEPAAVGANSQRATGHADYAIREADKALADDVLQELIAAYMEGRGARKDLKAATEAVQKALETYAAVLTKWQRASGDFKSALELHPSDLDAKTNAAYVDQSIARLVDRQQMMMMMLQGMKDKKEELAKMMGKLKGKIPKDEGDKMKGPNGEDDDDEEGKPKEPKPGDKERETKDGRENYLTREEASRLLDMLKLDTNRKLAYGEGDTTKPKDHKGRDW